MGRGDGFADDCLHRQLVCCFSRENSIRHPLRDETVPSLALLARFSLNEAESARAPSLADRAYELDHRGCRDEGRAEVLNDGQVHVVSCAPAHDRVGEDCAHVESQSYQARGSPSREPTSLAGEATQTASGFQFLLLGVTTLLCRPG